MTDVRHLLAKARPHRSVSERIEVLSGLLLETPYEANGLVGSTDTPEAFTASLEGFDCVTYVETVLALARAWSADGFRDELRKIRYRGGQVEWRHRNHYMTEWLRRNARLGVVRLVSPAAAGVRATKKDRRLDCVPGLPPLRSRFECVPKRLVPRFGAHLRAGDLIFFASMRSDLDVFHCGILVDGGGPWRMRHASRSRGSVVEQDLDEFLTQHRTPGVFAARPIEGARETR